MMHQAELSALQGQESQQSCMAGGSEIPKHGAGKGEGAVKSCSISLSHSVIPSQPSYSRCTSVVHHAWSDTNLRNTKAFAKHSPQLGITGTHRAGKYLPGTLYRMNKWPSSHRNLRGPTDLAARWLWITPGWCWPTTALPSNARTCPQPHTAPVCSPHSHQHQQWNWTRAIKKPWANCFLQATWKQDLICT